MLSQEKLLRVITADIKSCQDAQVAHNPVDIAQREQFILEHGTLTQHLRMTRDAGDDQAELERVVQSLEKNLVVRYRNWRGESTV